MARHHWGFACIGAAMMLLIAAPILGARAHGQTAAVAQNSAPAVSEAWIKLPAVSGRPAAAYFTVTGSTTPDRLLRVETPLAKRAEIHDSRMSGSAMTMVPVASLDIAPRSSVKLAPGGKHVMLFGLAPSVTDGTAVKLTLVFANAGKVSVNAQARNVTAAAPMMDGHDHGHHH